ncbi:MAG: CoA transferase [Ilumatobacteraceae bacterium]
MELHDRLFGATPAPGDDGRWAASGAMALTGWPDGPPLAAPASLVPFLRAVRSAIATTSDRLGRSVDLDTAALLGERAAIAGLARQGRRSCGGATELVRCGDGGWIAASLARPDDVELLPAWLGGTELAAGVAHRRADDVVAAGIELGIPCARLGEVGTSHPAFTATALVAGPPRPRLADALVVDLSSLWAGPLCGHVLTLAGAGSVVKVESTTRPDGARRGPPAFFDLLHAGQRSVALDLRDRADVERLRTLLLAADIVIESSRPRALAQLGIDAAATAAAAGAVWVSITGHGRHAEGASRVAFGDDAAVAGGLVAGPPDDPVCCADAVADPLTGLVAAATALDRFGAGGAWLVDVAMARVAAWCARDAPPTGPCAGPVADPRARPPSGQAAPLGRDTAAVFAALRAEHQVTGM